MKIIKLTIIILCTFILGVIAGHRLREYQYQFQNTQIEEDLFNNWDEYMSKNIMQGKDLPYYQKTKNEIMKMLPKPDYDYIYRITKNDSTYQKDMWLRRYWEELLSSDDSVKYMNRVEWYNMPDEDKPRLLILFEKKDSTWIERECIQWHPDKVFVD